MSIYSLQIEENKAMEKIVKGWIDDLGLKPQDGDFKASLNLVTG